MSQLFPAVCSRIPPRITASPMKIPAQLLLTDSRKFVQNHLFARVRSFAGTTNVHLGQAGSISGRSCTEGLTVRNYRTIFSGVGASFGDSRAGGLDIVGSGRSEGIALYSSQVQDPWQQRSSYKWFLPVQTRWKDNDQYGHVNNAVYHAIFDSVINVYLIRKSGLDPTSPSVPRGYMLSNSCRFNSSARYPHVYLAGLGVSHIGNSSVRYQLGLFQKTDLDSGLLVDLVQGHWREDEQVEEFDSTSVVTGEFIHVFVDPDTGKACPIPDSWRPQLKLLMTDNAGSEEQSS